MDYIYGKSNGKPTTIEKLVTTLNPNGKIESVREIKRFLEGYGDDEKLSVILAAITDLIPAAATALNQLADKQYVNDNISTAAATFRGTYNLVSDLSLTTSATEADIAAALASTIATADNNDYCYVEVPTDDATPTEIARTDRYKFNGTAWAFEFSLNGFTAAQWAAIDSGITALLVGKLTALPTANDIEAESAFQKNFATIMALSTDPNAGVTISTTNPEWKLVLTDNEDRILIGKRQDNTWYFATDLDTILDVIISGYTTT